MPTILTPPEVRQPRPSRRPDRDHPGEGDHGSGRRPPTDKRTGGNGDGDNWGGTPSGRHGPRERLSRARIGLFFALGGDMMFFVALISVFFVAKTSGHFDAYSRYINDWLPTSVPSILWLNTAVLFLSSLAAEAARRSMFREQDLMDEWFGLGRPTSRRAAVWLSTALVLGGLFLAGQWIAWDQLVAQHVFFNSNASSHFFYLITITHAIHLFLGIAALLFALGTLARSRQLLSRQVVVDATVWYWHAMGALWVFLFALLEFCQ